MLSQIQQLRSPWFFGLMVVGCGTPSPQAPFSLAASAPAEVRIGGKGSLVVTLSSGADYHINDDFPLSFTPENSSAGVVIAEPRLQVQATAQRFPCKVDKANSCSLQIPIPFEAIAPGRQRVAGVLAFSVCNAEKCLIEKQPVQVALDVSH